MYSTVIANVLMVNGQNQETSFQNTKTDTNFFLFIRCSLLLYNLYSKIEKMKTKRFIGLNTTTFLLVAKLKILTLLLPKVDIFP